MRSELDFAHNPKLAFLRWVAFYGALVVALLATLYYFADKIQTHTLPSGQLVLTIPHTKYLVGETIPFTLTNNYNSAIFVPNKCPQEPLYVYKLVNNKWERIHDTANQKDCKVEDREILVPANGSVVGTFAPWRNLFAEPGKYRVVVYVEFYNALPYQEFEVIQKPMPKPPVIVVVPSPTSTTSTRNQESENRTTNNTTTNTTNQTTYTVTVDSSGNYNVTSLTINAGDRITFKYVNRNRNEVVTVFSPGGTYASITLDSENTSRTRTFNTRGTWSLKVADHSGNTLVLTVK